MWTELFAMYTVVHALLLGLYSSKVPIMLAVNQLTVHSKCNYDCGDTQGIVTSSTNTV